MKKISIINLITIISTMLLGLFLYTPENTEASPGGSKITPTYESNTNDFVAQDGLVYTDQSQKSITINIPAQTGKVIKNLTWYNSEGLAVRKATGSWLNKPSYSGTDALQGTKVRVVANGGSQYGGVYYWDRSTGSNVWRSGGVDVIYTESSSCPSAPEDNWHLKAYPNCTDNRLPLTLVKTEPYKVEDNTLPGKDYNILNQAIIASTIKPIEIEPDDELPVTSTIHGVTGYSDPSTKYVGIKQQATYKDRIDIYYQQTFGSNSLNKGYFKDWASASARQMWYYVAFEFKFEAYTYMYKDKTLYVEWGDDPSTDPCIANPTTPGCTPEPSTPPDYTVTGDFDILPSSAIDWGNSFTLKPKNFVIPAACTYQYHEFRIERAGSTWTSNKIYTRTGERSFNQSTYPYVMGVGSHNVSIKVTANCATSEWVSHTLTVNERPFNNPPTFKAGWTTPGQWNQAGVQTKVIVGAQLDLVYLDNPAPSDPDGDPVTFVGFDFTASNTWAKQIPSKYAEQMNGYYRIAMDTPGNYCGKATMRDSFGASATQTACVEVVPQNPIPVISVPITIRENHPFTPAIHGDDSYSPMGRTINHTRDIWTNKKVIYTTAGPQTITLEVFDSEGLKSLAPASATINVLPDEPPIAVLNAPPLGIRQTSYDIFNNSYTTDGDIIVTAAYRYKYDSANDGFTNDSWIAMTGTLVKTTLKPTKVGKYQIELTVTENFGKAASTTAILDTTNLAPSVSFLVEGKNEQPEPNNLKQYSALEMINNWNLYKVNTNTRIANPSKNWRADEGKLVGGLGRGMERIYNYVSEVNGRYLTNMVAFQDYGYGDNGVSPYRAMINKNESYSQPLPWPETLHFPNSAVTFTQNWNSSSIVNITTNPKYAFIHYRPSGNNGRYLLALNKSKIGTYSFQLTDAQGKVNPTRTWNNGNPYDFILSPSSSKKISAPYLSLGSTPTEKRPYYQTMDASLIKSDGRIKEFTFSSNEPLDFQVAEKTIYRISYMISGYTSDFNLMDIESYDALTGEKIASTLEKGVYMFNPAGPMRFYTIGDNLMLYVEGREGTDIFLTFDRNGNMLSRHVIARRVEPRSYNGSPVNWIQSDINQVTIDGEGNLFRIYNMACKGANSWDCPATNEATEFYIDKVDLKQGKVAWTSALLGDNQTSPYCPTSWYGCYYSPPEARGTTQIVVNPANRDLMIRHNTPNYTDFGHQTRFQITNRDTGQSSLTTSYSFLANSSSFYMDKDGQYLATPSTTELGAYSFTSDGNLNRLTTTTGPGGTYSWTTGGIIAGSQNSVTAAEGPRIGQYIGDGLYLSWNSVNYGGTNKDDQNLVPWISKGTPTNNPQVFSPNDLGQFVSTDILDHAEISFTLRSPSPTSDSKLAGMSFRMTDPINRYAVETNGSTLYLSKYVNGARTVLADSAVTMQADIDYSYMISVQGTRIQVYVGGVPYMDEEDSTFSSGKFGPFSEKPYTDFSNIARKQLAEPTVQWMTSFAIWDQGTATADVRYSNILFNDPETDPIAGNYQWSITHTPKFLNNQGLSALNGQIRTSPALTFDKVGNYRVTLKAEDDPNPSYLFPNTSFADYRKMSNEYWQVITVHRRPVAAYSLSIKAADKTVVWNDTSYDPDRWISATNYSTEATGINYQTTRGVIERKYYYITPSGTRVNQKLVTPQETGTYSLGLQVKDEYGAWSYSNEQQITIAAIAIPDGPPTPGFTITPGTGNINTTFTINSTASDPEDGVAANIDHVYYVRNVTEGSSETVRSTNRGTWTTSFSSLGVIEVRQVVTDSKGQSAQMIRQVTVVNRPPVANFDWSPKPVYEGDTITITNLSSDPDGDTLSYTWSVSGPDGFAATMKTKDITINGVDTRDKPGIYQVILTVQDSSGVRATVTKAITVHLLEIQGFVLHTDAWEANRLRYNSLHPSKQRPANWFWAGEAFKLEAAVTDTGVSSTKPVSVIAVAATMPDLHKSLTSVSGSDILWHALLLEKDTNLVFEELAQGGYSFVFTVTYSNGVTKTSTVPIVIQDTVDNYVQVQRVH